MSPRKRERGDVLKAFGYVARPRREKVEGGVVLHYWTIRCRRQDDEGEWTLGWFPSRRAAEQEFVAWVAERQKGEVATGGTAKFLDVLGEYRRAVGTMTDKRDGTIRNRLYHALQLETFVKEVAPDATMKAFDDALFARYKVWLEASFAPQTCASAIIGARTFLRWAAAAKFVAEPPNAPKVVVPDSQHEPLFEDDVKKVLAVAKPPLDLLLRVLWEAGLRIAEALSLRREDVLVDDDAERTGFVRVQQRDAFTPKTEKSHRQVPIAFDLAVALRSMVARDDAKLFVTKGKHAYHHWRAEMQKAQREAGVEEFTFHAFRRAVADTLRRTKTPIDVYCRYMGHSAITGLRHYSVVSEDDLIDAHEKARAGARKRNGTQR